MKRVHYNWLTIATLLVTVITIVFGAFVRVSFSGDGCGVHWPDCKGSYVAPLDFSQEGLKRLIEQSHRHMTAILGIFIFANAFFAFRFFGKGSGARRAATYSVVFTLTEVIVGAILVKFGLVTYDQSWKRAIAMPLHLMNTYILMANLGMLCFFALTNREVSWKAKGTTATALQAMIVGLVVIGATGAISALGKTAYAIELASANSIAERFAMHLSSTAPALLRGGVLHPVLATSIGLLLTWLAGVVVGQRKSPEVRRAAMWTTSIYWVQFAFGIVNLIASAPAWMQLVHLVLALASWLSMVWLCGESLSRTEEIPQTAEVEAPARTAKEIVGALVAVTKPRVISLLLFTTYAAMIVAQKGWPDPWLTLWVMVGGYLSAGAANAFNMIVETDLDVAMERTAKRPSVTGKLSLKEIAVFAWVAAIGSFAMLWAAANLLTATMALCGLLTYVFVYTLWLKRRTWQNIVIGGAAGAFPPLVGYAAVTNSLSPLAWFLFGLVFTWTPVHFWALAMLIKDDYAKAGVPMLPVVKGDRVTVIQILIYAVITSLLCAVPFLQKEVGIVYLIGAGLLNLGLMVQSVKLFQNPDRSQARALFKFSMIYLALIFVVIALDKSFVVV